MNVRLIVFWSVLIVLWAMEFARPARRIDKGWYRKSISNFLVVVMNNGILLAMPLVPAGAAVYAGNNNLGIMNMVGMNGRAELILCLLILDLVIYWQHRLFHQIPLLWRLHRMHHMEGLLEVTSGFRFHPFEIIVSNFIKVAVIILLGISPLSVLVFEIWLNVMAMFTHGNILLPKAIEKGLKYIVFTPLKHNIHHSVIRKEMSSNYGFSVPWWDMLFKTYGIEGERGIRDIVIGLPQRLNDREVYFPGMLMAPFYQNK